MKIPELTDAQVEEFLHRCPNCAEIRDPARDDCRHCGASSEFCCGIEEAEDLFWNRGDYAAAGHLPDRLVSIMPWSVYVLNLRITAAYELDDVAAMLRCLPMLFDCAEAEADALRMRALLLEQVGDCEGAEADLEKALRAYPGNDHILADLNRVRECLETHGGEFAA